ncbi:hypothetical protein [Virgibacillus salexigens]|uniref:hypothetical protein n=1 Tax=Virgibacillus salexigens TaxID=61016 RepID=UPI003081F035
MNFFKSDLPKAKKEIDCYNYCANNAVRKLNNEKFGEAAAYLENAIRSLHELEKMQVSKENADHHMFELEKIRGQQYVNKVIFDLRSRL